ncbi:MAG TPA: efflux RND transporter periplasmic adaptor subunit [Acidobacteriota bacterium]|nr:efflux RND transporter periplasmic adaptor subunit [Acidobacteriota bacterium]
MRHSILSSVFLIFSSAVVLLLATACGAPVGDAVSGHQLEEDHAGENEAEPGHSGEEEETGESHELHLTAEEIEEFGIETSIAEAAVLKIEINLPGEVQLNEDRIVHVAPVLCGVVEDVFKSQGDFVNEGDRLAVLNCREFADAKAVYLAGIERLALAKAVYEREEDLWREKITSEQEYLDAKRNLAEREIELRLAKQKLFALGLFEEDVEEIVGQPESKLTEYSIAAPIKGVIINRHISRGEAIDAGSEVFMIADLSTVWVDLRVYQKDLPFVSKGSGVLISAGHDIPDAMGEILFVDPVVDEKTRTAMARIVLPNPDGLWKPGLFVTAGMTAGEVEVPVAVLKTAVQIFDGLPHVFVPTEQGYEALYVTTGDEDSTHVEILTGLAAGQPYVSKGGFTLKSELEKGSYGDGHNH